MNNMITDREDMINLRKAFGLKDTDPDSAQTETPVAEQTYAAEEKKPNVADILKEKIVSFVDQLKRGEAL